MRKIVFSIMALAALASCDLNKLPLDKVSPDTFYNTASDLKLHTSSFYENLIPSGEGVYNETQDNIVKTDLSSEIRGTRIVPTSGGGWSWSVLRNINFYLVNSVKCQDLQARDRYDGVARFFRATFYYNMVAKFGDVPWYDGISTETDEEFLTKARDSREVVMDKVLEDLDFAIENLPTAHSVNEVNKWTALALKARICLFEGTFRKYHTEFNTSGGDKFLTEAAEAAGELIKEGGFSLYSTGNPEKDYMNLFSSMDAQTCEVILARSFSNDVQVYHNVNYYTMTASYGRPGLEKAIVDSYLMRDGSRFTDVKNHETMDFYEEMQDRDPRLSQTVRTPGYKRIGGTETLVPEFGSTVTGYQMIKFVTDASGDTYFKACNDLPIYRLAEVMLAYAEAKAELGTLTQDDLDMSINKIRTRAGMPEINLAAANANPDETFAKLSPSATGANRGIILEIRRERRIEMVMENQRWNDILRWKEGSTTSRDYKGMYFQGPGVYDLDRDGENDLCLYEGDKPEKGNVQYMQIGTEVMLTGGNSGNIVVNPHIEKVWTENKDYLCPIPIQERQLNPNLTQNPGWDDGL